MSTTAGGGNPSGLNEHVHKNVDDLIEYQRSLVKIPEDFLNAKPIPTTTGLKFSATSVIKLNKYSGTTNTYKYLEELFTAIKNLDGNKFKDLQARFSIVKENLNQAEVLPPYDYFLREALIIGHYALLDIVRTKIYYAEKNNHKFPSDLSGSILFYNYYNPTNTQYKVGDFLRALFKYSNDLPSTEKEEKEKKEKMFNLHTIMEDAMEVVIDVLGEEGIREKRLIRKRKRAADEEAYKRNRIFEAFAKWRLPEPVRLLIPGGGYRRKYCKGSHTRKRKHYRRIKTRRS